MLGAGSLPKWRQRLAADRFRLPPVRGSAGGAWSTGCATAAARSASATASHPAGLGLHHNPRRRRQSHDRWAGPNASHRGEARLPSTDRSTHLSRTPTLSRLSSFAQLAKGKLFLENLNLVRGYDNRFGGCVQVTGSNETQTLPQLNITNR